MIGLLIFIAAHLAGGTVFSALSSRILAWTMPWSGRRAAPAGYLRRASPGRCMRRSFCLIRRTSRLRAWFWNKLLLAVGGLSGLGAALFGYSRKTSVAQGQEARPEKRPQLEHDRGIGGDRFLFVLIWECSYLFDQTVFGESFAGLIEQRRISVAHFITFFWAFAVLAIWSFVASYFVNVNKFSLHGFYRNRLIRSYLGATNSRGVPTPSPASIRPTISRWGDSTAKSRC